MGTEPSISERLAVRERPDGWPVMYQSWGWLLFMHWRLSAEALQPFIPPRLRVDTFDGSAWIALTPFTLWGARPVLLPPLPWLSAFHEINVRTYVHLDGVPGVWFFSLDANRLIPVLGARATFHLPYKSASIHMEREGRTIDYRVRRQQDAGPAEFHAHWTVGEPLPEAVPGSLEFFLTERYCLYAARGENLYRAQIHHRPWPLQAATFREYNTNLFTADGLPTPEGDPIVHSGGPVDVEVWPIERV